MKVKELIEKLNKFDQESQVLCYTEDDQVLDEGHLFKLFDIDNIDISEGETERDEDRRPTIRWGKTSHSRKFTTLHITGIF